MNYWWVNQNQTYIHEVRGGYLWSPKTKSDGTRNPFYDTMAMVSPGDVVFSFADTLIKAIGVATGKASTTPRPAEYGPAGSQWVNVGWYVPVEFRTLSRPIKPKDHMDSLKPLLPTKYAPLRDNGDGKQNLYLTEIPFPLAQELTRILGGQVEKIVSSIGDVRDEYLNESAEQAIKERQDILETEKEQLVKSRRGQGLFRSRVELIEPRCRVTGISDREHLRASHIKPWRISDNSEKLDGANGLLLSPHVDHLFDRGFISFEDNGKLLVSTFIDKTIFTAWGIDPDKNVGSFSGPQKAYLKYHRENIFKTDAN